MQIYVSFFFFVEHTLWVRCKVSFKIIPRGRRNQAETGVWLLMDGGKMKKKKNRKKIEKRLATTVREFKYCAEMAEDNNITGKANKSSATHTNARARIIQENGRIIVEAFCTKCSVVTRNNFDRTYNFGGELFIVFGGFRLRPTPLQSIPTKSRFMSLFCKPFENNFSAPDLYLYAGAAQLWFY